MRVQFRLLAVMGLLGFVFLAGFLILRRNQTVQLTAVNAARRVEVERLFQKILTMEGREIETLAFDYTYWDELVDFITTRDPQWARNILYTSLQNYGINAIWVYDAQFNLVYETTNLAGGIAPPIPIGDETMRGLFEQNYLTSFAFRAPDNTLLEVRGASIHPSADVAHSTPPRGYFFVGRAWLPERIQAISAVTGAQISIVNGQEAAPEKLSRELRVYYPLKDAGGSPLAYVRGIYDSSFMQGFSEAQQHDTRLFAIFTSSLLFLFAIGFILWIVLPLHHVTASLRDGSVSHIQALQKDRGEFGRIAGMISAFFEQKNAMAEQIQRQQSAETNLRLSEERYRILSQISSDVSFIFHIQPDQKGILTWGAEQISQMAGYPIDNHIDLSALEPIIHPDDRQQISAWGRDLLQGKAVESILRILTRENGVRWIRVKILPFLAEKEGSLQIYGTALDITIQKAAEEAYRSLVDQSPLGLSLLQDERIIFANPAFARMVGSTREELSGLSPEEIAARVHPDDLPACSAILHDIFTGKMETADQTLRIRHSDGSWRWLELTAIVTEYQGKPTLQIAYNDVTERVQTVSALAERTAYSDILFNTVSSLILVSSPDGQIKTMNPAARAFLNQPDLESRPLALWECFSVADTAPISAANFAATAARQELVDNVDMLYNGHERRSWLSWSHRYQFDQEGKVTGIVGAAIDITEGRLRERQREAIAGIATALRGSTTRQETIQTILSTILDYMEAHSVSIVFPIPDRREMVIEAALGEFAPELVGVRMSDTTSVAGAVMRSGKPYYSNNPQEEKDFALTELMDRIGPTAWAPLISEDKPVGLLIISRRLPIRQEDIDLFQPVVDMAAGAVDRTTRSDQAQKRIQQLSALQSINLAIGASLDLSLTLNVLAVQMTTQLGADAVAVYLRNPNTKLMRCTAHNGFRTPVMESFQLWEGEGQAGRVAMERRSRHIYDPAGIEGYFFPATLYKGEEFVAYDAVPLVVKGEVKGVIEAFHRAPYNASGEWLQLLEALALETAIAIDNAELLEKLQRSNQDLKIAYDTTIEGWARSLEQFGIEWGLHSRRVVDLTVKLAQWLGISGNQLTQIRYGALLHDIGKIGVPLSILDKPGKLTPEEWVIVKKHPDFAYSILHDIPFLGQAMDIPYHHHERWNGSGYPDGLSGEEIPLAARIFAVVDIFDALTNQRPYRDVWSEEDALAYLKDAAGKEVDPKIAKAFAEMYPLLGLSRGARRG